MKSDIRKLMRQIFAPEDASSLWQKVEALPSFKAAETVLMYMALPDEVPTLEFIKHWSGIKRIAIPLVQGDILVLREYAPEHLARGYNDILEPTAEAQVILPEEVDLAIIPGVAFDRRGMRLGRGKGFYDRLLPSLQCPKIGVCQSWRMIDSVPAEAWDIPMDMVITP